MNEQAGDIMKGSSEAADRRAIGKSRACVLVAYFCGVVSALMAYLWICMGFGFLPAPGSSIRPAFMIGLLISWNFLTWVGVANAVAVIRLRSSNPIFMAIPAMLLLAFMVFLSISVLIKAYRANMG